MDNGLSQKLIRGAAKYLRRPAEPAAKL